MAQQTLNLSPETITDFARQVQDIVPACPVTDVPEQKRGAKSPRFCYLTFDVARGRREKDRILPLQNL